jgi:ACS family allantoate permease-like MFS transporter
MLVGLPSGAIQIATSWIAAFAMRYTKNGRCLWGILLTLIPLVGSIVLLTLPGSHPWGIVVSTWLAAQSSSLMVVSLSIMASNVKGNTKKSVVGAIFFLGYSTGCIVGPQLWQAPDAPRYIKGCVSSIVSWALLLTTFAMYYVVFRQQNSKRDALLLHDAEEEAGHAPLPEKLDQELRVGLDVDSDLTDRQDLKFRYAL